MGHQTWWCFAGTTMPDFMRRRRNGNPESLADSGEGVDWSFGGNHGMKMAKTAIQGNPYHWVMEWRIGPWGLKFSWSLFPKMT